MPDLFDVPWVVAGGKIGETGYCMRCGEGFSAAMPISITGLTKSIEAFVKKHAHCPEGRASEPEIKAPGDWIASRWTGISSATIWSVMTGMPSPYKAYNHPLDSQDFHRCYRLLALFPEWRSRLDEVAQRFPFWGPFVREWNTLTTLFEQAFNEENSSAPALHRLMQSLEDEAERYKNGKSYWTGEDLV